MPVVVVMTVITHDSAPADAVTDAFPVAGPRVYLPPKPLVTLTAVTVPSEPTLAVSGLLDFHVMLPVIESGIIEAIFIVSPTVMVTVPAEFSSLPDLPDLFVEQPVIKKAVIVKRMIITVICLFFKVFSFVAIIIAFKRILVTPTMYQANRAMREAAYWFPDSPCAVFLRKFPSGRSRRFPLCANA